ncbi:unnamed protein product [Pleuronectes platessa]|uniref:Uncharacterized protein n=1 Tax=Pleuronectes platessa TaxID=8262 RepID=A0A9N7U2V5_PLEPL|nr:unnamed protein product [Pleuronectes platessa]
MKPLGGGGGGGGAEAAVGGSEVRVTCRGVQGLPLGPFCRWEARAPPYPRGGGYMDLLAKEQPHSALLPPHTPTLCSDRDLLVTPRLIRPAPNVREEVPLIALRGASNATPHNGRVSPNRRTLLGIPLCVLVNRDRS